MTRSLTAACTWCTVLLKLKLVPCFRFYKECKMCRYTCTFNVHLLRYMCAKNYKNRERFDKDIAKMKQYSFCIHYACFGGSKRRARYGNKLPAWPAFNSKVCPVVCAKINGMHALRLISCTSLMDRRCPP